MIILDIETTGLDPVENGMVSLGAVDLKTGDEFYGECCVEEFIEISDKAMEVNGFTLDQIYDPSKPADFELYVKFLKWCEGRDKLIGGQQVASFDLAFLKNIHGYVEWYASKSDLASYALCKGIEKWPFGHRSVDLHSVAYARFGKSLSLDGILTELGLSPEPKPHNALTGARLEAQAFKLLLKND